MDYEAAIAQVLEDAGRVVLPGESVDVVTLVERDFARQGYCDHQLVAVIEEALRQRLAQWSVGDKRAIWVTLVASGAINDSEESIDDYPAGSIDLTIEGELMYLITERLSPPNERKRREPDDEDEEEAW